MQRWCTVVLMQHQYQFQRFNLEFVPHHQQPEQNLTIDGEEVGLEQRLNGAGPFSLFICRSWPALPHLSIRHISERALLLPFSVETACRAASAWRMLQALGRDRPGGPRDRRPRGPSSP